MLKVKKLILSTVLATLGLTGAHAATPTKAQILQWLVNPQQSTAEPKKAIQVVKTEKITLVNGEEAYISGVEFENAARNFWGGYILTRPNAKKAQILDEFGGQSNTFKVHKTNYKGKLLDIVELEQSSSGGGAISGASSLVVFKGDKLQVLASGENSGTMMYDDCRKDKYIETEFKIKPNSQTITQITTTSNGCEEVKKQNKKVKTELIPIAVK